MHQESKTEVCAIIMINTCQYYTSFYKKVLSLLYMNISNNSETSSLYAYKPIQLKRIKTVSSVNHNYEFCEC